ncbi:MAG: hypothetical protein WKF60_04240, partial [Ilumatobacter sp.]
APGGRLLIVDFAPHSLEFLRTDHAHRRLGFRDDTIVGWLEQSGLDVGATRTIEAPVVADADNRGRLAVSLWTGIDPRPADTRTTLHQEVAS